MLTEKTMTPTEMALEIERLSDLAEQREEEMDEMAVAVRSALNDLDSLRDVLKQGDTKEAVRRAESLFALLLRLQGYGYDSEEAARLRAIGGV